MISIKCCSLTLMWVGAIHWQEHQSRPCKSATCVNLSQKGLHQRQKIGWVQPVQQQPDSRNNNTTFVCFFCWHQLTHSESLKESVSLCAKCDSFITGQPLGNSRGPCIKIVTMVIYEQSGRGVSEYCDHRHNGAAVTGHFTQLARQKVGRFCLSRMQQLAALGVK